MIFFYGVVMGVISMIGNRNEGGYLMYGRKGGRGAKWRV